MLKTVLNKILTALVWLRHGKVEYHLRYFYRDTYYCRLVQLKYIFKDFFIRKKYKTLSFSGEFAPELLFVLPFAYWHYKNGTLKATRSSKFTSEFYFFSPDHQETFDLRTMEGNYNFEMPRISYSHNYNLKKWMQVPLKEKYQNDIFIYDKPVLIVANRYNMEWNQPPISYFDIPALQFIFDKLLSRYTIIYNRPVAQNIAMDNSVIYDLKEFDWIRKNYPEVILMEDLFKANKEKVSSYNHLQLMVYANAENFISIHGGTSALASYFGGTNLILSKYGPEHYFRCFERLYPKLSGSQIFHAKTDGELKQLVEELFVKKKLISGNAFAKNISGVMVQQSLKTIVNIK